MSEHKAETAQRRYVVTLSGGKGSWGAGRYLIDVLGVNPEGITLLFTDTNGEDEDLYRFLREWTPGPYTFVLEATRETPRRLWHPSRKTIGLRVPSSPVASGLLEAHGAPLLVTTLALPGETDPLHEADEILERLGKRIDAVIDAGGQGYEPTTVIDLTAGEPAVIRAGCGPLRGLEPPPDAA